MATRRQRPAKRPRPKKAAAEARAELDVMREGGHRHLAILSRKRSLYSTSRMVEAIRARRLHPLVLDTLRCNMIIANAGARMTFRGVEIRGLEAVIPRIGASITQYGLAVVNHLEVMGIPVVNKAPPIARSRDKLRCLQLLAQAGLSIPATVLARDRSNVAELVEQVGGLPAIVKLTRGTQGVGVMIASTLAEVQSMLDTFFDLGQEIVLQEFIKESKGVDVRAMVVGDRVVGAMRRQAKKGEFRSNIHRGGEGTPIELPAAYATAAVKAARVIGLEVCGVDMLESSAGPKIMEINSSPGFEGLERATGADIAGAIADHAIAYAAAQRRSQGRREAE